MVDVAQLVRALVCGTRGRGFESHLPPQLKNLFVCNYSKPILGCSQVVRHQTLTLAFRRFESSHPSQSKKTGNGFFLHLFDGRARKGGCQVSSKLRLAETQAKNVQWTVFPTRLADVLPPQPSTSDTMVSLN